MLFLPYSNKKPGLSGHAHNGRASARVHNQPAIEPTKPVVEMIIKVFVFIISICIFIGIILLVYGCIIIRTNLIITGAVLLGFGIVSLILMAILYLKNYPTSLFYKRQGALQTNKVDNTTYDKNLNPYGGADMHTVYFTQEITHTDQQIQSVDSNFNDINGQLTPSIVQAQCIYPEYPLKVNGNV